jgi:ATP-dependent DNA helicase RecG
MNINELKTIIKTGEGYTIELFPKVKFETSSDWFKVIFERELVSDGLKHPLKHPLNTLYGLISKNPGINREQLSDLTGISINTLKDQIKKLIEENLIERKGSKKTGGYFVK